MKGICLVTGASSGIGLAVATALLEEGHTVVGIARREDMLRDLESRWQKRFRGLVHDVAEPGLGEKLDALGELAEGIDLCVHAAGCAHQGVELGEMSDRQILEQVQVNALGLALTLRDMTQRFRKRGKGTVIAIGSVAARDAAPGMAVYSATKAFTSQLLRSLRADLHGSGIRICCLKPGTTRTPLLDGQLFSAPLDRYDGFAPLEPDDIARTVLWVYGAPPHVNVQEMILFPVDQAPYVRGISRAPVAHHAQGASGGRA